MASIAKTAFEVSVSNITRNNVQNVPGYFGAMVSSDFVGDICPAGFLVVRSALVKSEGYEAQNIKNGNTWQMVTAADGSAGAGRPGDRSGIFAFNTYDVRQVDDGLNLWKLGANFLGLELPVGIRGDFTEIIIGEQYTFGEGNFSTPPADDTYKYATISNGLLVASSSAPADGSGVYFEILRSKRFTEGGRDAGFVGYVCEAKRAAVAIPAELPAVTNVDAGKALMVNSSGEWAADNLPKELPAATALNAGEVLGVDSSGNYALMQASGGVYGPYIAAFGTNTSTSLAANAATFVAFSNFFSLDGGEEYNITDPSVIIPATFAVNLKNTSAPDYKLLALSADIDWNQESTPIGAVVWNRDSNAIDLKDYSVSMSFYTTQELQPIEQGE